MPDAAAPTWSPRQRRMLAALGLDPLRRRAAQTSGGITLEADPEVLQSPIAGVILRWLALDPAAANRKPTDDGRVRLCWPHGSGAVHLPSLAELRSAEGKRALWPQLRRFARARSAQ